MVQHRHGSKVSDRGSYSRLKIKGDRSCGLAGSKKRLPSFNLLGSMPRPYTRYVFFWWVFILKMFFSRWVGELAASLYLAPQEASALPHPVLPHAEHEMRNSEYIPAPVQLQLIKSQSFQCTSRLFRVSASVCEALDSNDLRFASASVYSYTRHEVYNVFRRLFPRALGPLWWLNISR